MVSLKEQERDLMDKGINPSLATSASQKDRKGFALTVRILDIAKQTPNMMRILYEANGSRKTGRFLIGQDLLSDLQVGREYDIAGTILGSGKQIESVTSL
jgi:hypothetical protein